ncbi:MAG TPA: nuclear transport factor 2 family protein [Chitinophagaceae bacterium]|nr:nuclear transport factor 2 family protein [Chitinophagaceae bacterium]
MKKTYSFILGLLILAAACHHKKPSIFSDEKEPVNTKEMYKPADSVLYLEILRMDSLMFDAFNRHSTDSLMMFFSEDLEFYHDKGGLDDFEITRKKSVQLFENNKTNGLRRELLKESLEVYPIPGYGAVETCLHRFCHKENGADDCGVFKNIMIWKKTNEGWKVTRVISYDH